MKEFWAREVVELYVENVRRRHMVLIREVFLQKIKRVR
jgi:hypothetical protein